MRELPPELAAWSTPLSAFAVESAAQLGPWLPRLAAALGPLVAAPDAAPDGEPDGVDGIARRGRWERLLASSLVLMDAAPEEFLRRAAEGEHLFLRTARARPSRALRSVVLFDAGPRQLGAPRILHLALLVVLAARAERRGFKLCWGVLQGEGLTEGVDRQGMEALLNARSANEIDAAGVARWAAELRGDDAWVIGGEGTPRLGRAGVVRVEDVVAPGVRALDVAVERADGTEAALRLDLPSPIACRHLMVAPWSGPQRPVAPSLPTAARMVLDPSGSGVIVDVGSRVEAWRLPRFDDRAKVRIRPGGEVVVGEGGRVVAVGRHRQRLVALVLREGRLEVLPGMRWYPLRPDVHPPVELPDGCDPGLADAPLQVFHALPAMLAGGARTSRSAVVFRDARGSIWVASFDRGTVRRLEVEASEVVRHDATLTWAVPHGPLRSLVRLTFTSFDSGVDGIPGLEDAARKRVGAATSGPLALHRGYAGGPPSPTGYGKWIPGRTGQLLLAPPASLFHLGGGVQSIDASGLPAVPAGVEVVGVADLVTDRLVVGIVPDTAQVVAIGALGTATSAPSPVPIVSAVVLTTVPAVAWLRADGRLVFARLPGLDLIGHKRVRP